MRMCGTEREIECMSVNILVLLGLQGGGQVHAGSGGHGPALPGGLVGLQQTIKLLQMRHNVVLDVGDGDLQTHAATVE